LSAFVTDALVVAIVLGVMIFLHELGHFVAAKSFGVRVLVFSLGFGKSLLHYQHGDTDYRISALPFGGYVKMAGDDPSETRQGDQGEFLSQPRWRRFVIVLMGPVMNVVLAILLLTGLYKVHFQRPAYLQEPVRVGDIESGSPAAQANIHPGDLILRFGNQESPKWEDVEFKVLTSPNETFPLEIERDGTILKTSLTTVAVGADREGYAGWDPIAPGILESIEPGLPAEKAGLKPGDKIVEIDGHKALYFPNIVHTIQVSNGKPIALEIERQGKEFPITLQPVYREMMGEKRWWVGFRFHDGTVVLHLSLAQALGESLQDNARNCLVTFDVLGKILTRRMSARSLSGPIGIAEMSGKAYRAGFSELLFLVSFISLQLGIFNLLPIPVLDGGVIMLLLVESVIRRDLSLEVKERFVQVGIVFLLLLAAFVMYNDLVKTFRPY
jgi:regulator of sigma E protease